MFLLILIHAKNLLNKTDNYKFFKINFLLLKDILIKYTYLKLVFFFLNVCYIYIYILINTEYLKKKFEQHVFFLCMFLLILIHAKNLLNKNK